ncbi:MAG TPA: hypothetical protein PKW54_11045 [Ferruginibacter sp.]|nr:hypothetical protein [Ferruginibacter sp.]
MNRRYTYKAIESRQQNIGAGADGYISSFTEFVPFCKSLFYYSSFKDFNTASPA